jgi:subtilase family serine protease
MSFLTGFYIDNQYMGYVAVNENIGVGKTAEATFTWVATPGEHVVKVVANDILDNLKESDKKNNSMTVALSSGQVTFADVRVNDIYWYPENSDRIYNNQEPFQYRAEIENIGDRAAEAFSVGLYIDGEYVSRQVIIIILIVC